MKKRTRVLSLLLAVVMLVGLLPTGIFAADGTGTSVNSGTGTHAVAYTEKVADDSTQDVWGDLLNTYESTQYLGRVWTDKTVAATTTTDGVTTGVTVEYKLETNETTGRPVTADPTTIATSNDADFQVVLSAMSSTASYTTVTTSAGMLDIVLVLDTSNSMKNNNGTLNGSSLQSLMTAVNAFLAEVAEANADITDANAQHKVSIITYDGSSADTDDSDTVSYGSGATSVIYELGAVTSSNLSTVQAKVSAISPAIKGGGGDSGLGKTQTNAGMDAAVDVLQSSAARADAIPAVILFTDGTPNIAVGNNFDAGIAADCVNIAYLLKNNATVWNGGSSVTLPTSGSSTHTYTKDEYNIASTKNAMVYSVAVLSGADTDDVPTGTSTSSRNINYMMQAISSNYPNAAASYTLSSPGSSRNTWTMYPGTANSDGAEYYFAASNSSGLTDLFTNIAGSVIASATVAASPTYTVAGMDSSMTGYVTMVDELGDFMEVKSVDAITIEGVIHTAQGEPTTSTSDGYSETTYVFTDSASLNTTLAARQTNTAHTESLSSIIIKERNYTDPATRDTMTVMIPASLLPLRYYSVDENDNLTIEETLPVRVVYSVGLLDQVRDALKSGDYESVSGLTEYMEETITDAAGNVKLRHVNDDGEISFYANYWDGQDSNGDGYSDGNTYSTFSPANTNPFYYYTEDTVFYKEENGQYVPVTEADGYKTDLSGTVYYKQTYYTASGPDSTYIGLNVDTAIQVIGITWDDIASYIGINADGQYYMIKGNAKLSLASATNFIDLKGTGNKTATATTVLNPTWNADAVAGNYATYATQNYMGNNGRITFAGLGSLTVRKDVEYESYQTPDANTEFTMTITLSDPSDATYSAEATYNGVTTKTTVTFTGGVATVVLKDGGSITIHGIPDGVTYTVEETSATLGTDGTNLVDKGIYVPSYNYLDATKTIDVGETDEVGVQNKYTYVPNSVDATFALSGSKTLNIKSGSSYNQGDITFKYYLQYWTGNITDDMNNDGYWAYVKSDGTHTSDSGAGVFGTATVSDTKKNDGIDYTNINAALANWQFTKPGVYYFRVIEEGHGQTLNGIYYDSTAHVFVITVKDEGNGTLRVTDVSSSHADAATGNTTITKWSQNSSGAWTNGNMNFTNAYGTWQMAVEIDKTINDTTNSGYEAATGYSFDWTYLGAYYENEKPDPKDYDDLAYTGDNSDEANGITDYTRTDAGLTYLNIEYGVTVPTSEYQAPGLSSTGLHVYVTKDANGDFINGTYYEYYRITERSSGVTGITDSKQVYIVEVAVTLENGEITDITDSVVQYTNNDRKTYTYAGYIEGMHQWEYTNNGTTETIRRAENDDLIFANTYEASVPVTMGVTKTLTGREWNNNDSFKFTLMPIQYEGAGKVFKLDAVKDAAGNTTGYKAVVSTSSGTGITATATSSALAKFPEITFTEVGTYYFKVTENQGALGGVTYSTATHYAKVVVTADSYHNLVATVTTLQDGQLTASNGAYNLGTFTNTYRAAPVSVTLSGTKTMTGRDIDMKQGEFTFGLYSGETLVATTANKTGGTYSFPAQTFAATGTYTYTVKELDGGVGGVHYDKTVYVVDIVVTDDGSGTLIATTSVKDSNGNTGSANALNFANYYAASGVLPLTVVKTIDGRDWRDGDKFTFGLYDKMPTEDGAKCLQTIQIGAASVEAGTTTMSNAFAVEIKGEGTYTYYIQETGTSSAGMTMDDSVYKIVVVATDNGDGTLKFDTTYSVIGETGTTSSIAFVNKYKPKPTDVNLKVSKALDGREWQEGDAFTFTLTAKDGAPMPGSNTVTVTKVGEAFFDAITFTNVGTYYYTIQEQGAGKTVNGVTFDGKTYTVKVVVADYNYNGQLGATVTYNDASVSNASFTNSYKASPGYATIGGTKTLNGRELTAGEFSFVLKDSEGTVIETVTNKADGSFVFSAIEYTQTGKHYYTVSEVAGSDANMIYDKTVYNVTVTVTDNYKGQLSAAVSYADAGSGTAAAKAAFENTYLTSVNTPASFSIQKVDKDDNAKVLSGAVFTLYEDDKCTKAVDSQTTDANGLAVFNGYTSAATYYLKETTAPDGYELVDTVWEITVELKDGVPSININKSEGVFQKIYNWIIGDVDPDSTWNGETLVLTVANTPVALAEISVKKTWDDDNYSGRPTEIQATLYRDGVAYDTVVLNAANGWTHTWSGTVYADGHTWTVDEPSVPTDYVKAVTNEEGTWTITNTRLTDVDNPASFSIQKVDADTKEVLSGAVFTLYSDKNCKTAVNTQTTGVDGKATFGGFTDAETYYLKETTAPAGYELVDTVWEINVKLKDGDPSVKVDKDEGIFQKVYNWVIGTVNGSTWDGETLTLTIENEPIGLVGISVQKTWDDGDYYARPTEVAVTLYQDGTAYETVKLNGDNNWSYTWSGDEYTDQYNWTVDEPTVPDGYVKSVTNEGSAWTITNTRTPKEIEITVTKAWVNNGGVQPESIDVTLYKNGTAYETVTLSDANNWTKTWTGLTDAAQWSVEETAVPTGYESSITVDGYTFKITNTRIIHPVKVSVNKVWVATSAVKHPDSVEAVLYKNGEAYDKVTLSADNNWSHTWDDLTDEFTWTVDESTVPSGYNKTISHSNNSWTITNTHVDIPKTGDDSHLGLWITLMLVAALSIFGLGVVGKKRRKYSR